MAALTGDATLPKRRLSEAVLRAGDGFEEAGVAAQAARQNRPSQVRGGVLVISRREIPLPVSRVVGHWGFEEEAAGIDQITAGRRTRPDKVTQLLFSAERSLRGPAEFERISILPLRTRYWRADLL